MHAVRYSSARHPTVDSSDFYHYFYEYDARACAKQSAGRGVVKGVAME